MSYGSRDRQPSTGGGAEVDSEEKTVVVSKTRIRVVETGERGKDRGDSECGPRGNLVFSTNQCAIV